MDNPEDTARNARRLEVLKRRVRHLDDRIELNEGQDLSYDKAEASALRWAIDILERTIFS